jgi:inosine-uridine nucleoside N-ribohydrolase
MVRKYPHQVTIYAGGPMTDLALAIALDPQFPQLARELIFMGGSLNPQTDDPEFATNPRHEFNFWFDPEAAEIVLRAPWKKIVGTPTDISIKTRLTPAMMQQIKASGTPLAQYLARYYQQGLGADYMWDELTAAAWLDPSLIIKHELRYMGVDLGRGAGYGNTLTWTEQDQPQLRRQAVEIQQELDTVRFYRMFIGLMSAATPPTK